MRTISFLLAAISILILSACASEPKDSRPRGPANASQSVSGAVASAMVSVLDRVGSGETSCNDMQGCHKGGGVAVSCHMVTVNKVLRPACVAANPKDSSRQVMLTEAESPRWKALLEKVYPEETSASCQQTGCPEAGQIYVNCVYPRETKYGEDAHCELMAAKDFAP